MAKNREELTRKAVEEGLDVAPGQLAAAGLVELPEGAEGDPEAEKDAAPLAAGEGQHYRLRLVNHVTNDQGAPDHVVRAKDKANARDTFMREMGILELGLAHNKLEVSEASEQQYIAAQAKRLRVDLREHRAHPKDKKHPEHGMLTWQPPGGVAGKYKVSEKGELSAVE